jgi:hypothetical protein
MQDFEVSDDISMNIEPAVIAPDNAFAFHSVNTGVNNAVGLRLGIRF